MLRQKTRAKNDRDIVSMIVRPVSKVYREDCDDRAPHFD